MEWQKYVAATQGRGGVRRPYTPPPRGLYVPRGVIPMIPRGGRPYMPPRGFAGAVGQDYGRGRRVTDVAHPYGQTERSLVDVCSRYPRLAVSPDLVTVVHHWPEQNIDVPLDVAIPFHTDPDYTLPVPDVDTADPDAAKVIARVMLLTVPKPEEPEGDKKPAPQHLTKQIKFLVAKRTNGGLMAIGGPWSKKDGADPKSDKVLIKTAIRHCKEISGIDLSGCKNWYKLVEMKYKRESGVVDRTVVFLPDIWATLAGKDQVKVHKQMGTKEVEEEEEVEVEEEVEEEGEVKEGEEKKKVMKKIKKKVTTKKTVDEVKIRCMDLSLHGILDYNAEDKHEETTELSLSAEAFDEMLCSRFAKDVLKVLQVKKEKYDVQMAEMKRKREEEQKEREAKLAKDKEEREAKKKKLEEEKEKEAELKKQKEEEEKDMTEEQLKERREKEAEEKKQKEEEAKKKREEEIEKRKAELEAKKKAAEEERQRKLEEEKNKKTRTQVITHTHVDEAILAPFSYFDKPMGAAGQQIGSLKREQVEGILLAMGHLPPREVDGLLRGCGLAKEKGSSALYYKSLATTTTTETKEVPIEEPKKEEEKKEEEKKEEETK